MAVSELQFRFSCLRFSGSLLPTPVLTLPTIGIVGVLVPSDDLVEALAKEREGGMSDTLVHATVVESSR
jgi:hypothetical protein